MPTQQLIVFGQIIHDFFDFGLFLNIQEAIVFGTKPALQSQDLNHPVGHIPSLRQ